MDEKARGDWRGGRGKPTDEEIVNYYVDSHVEDVKAAMDDQKQVLVKKIKEQKYGPGFSSPVVVVNWGRLFKENVCPSCGDAMSLKEKEYLCGKCGLSVPLELYDKVKKQHLQEVKSMEARREFTGRIRDNGIDKKHLDELYSKALAIASSKIPEEGNEKK